MSVPAVSRWLRCLVGLLILPSLALGEDWPRFRGPAGQGTSTETGLPVRWGADQNIAWKVDVPGEGWSSPVVWGDRVYLTTATDGGQSCHVLAFSRGDGKAVWDVEVLRQQVRRKEGKNSYATPTPVTDGNQIYAVFNDGGIAAVNADGTPAWVNHDVSYYSQHGLGGSPILYRDTLIMSFDGSSEGPDRTVGWQKPWDRSFLLALDRRTGKERWRAQRGQSRIAHTTPIVVTVAGRDELVSSAGDVIQGFDPATGERRWSVRAEGEGAVPSPVVGEGLVFTASGFGNPRLRAVRLGDTGAAAGHDIAWESKRIVPMMPSAVYVSPWLFVVTEKGIAACFEAATGKLHWQERIGGSYSASPVAADGHVYFLSEDGETVVIKASATFTLVARNPLREPCQASMAVSRRQLFLRTKDHLFRIGKE